MLLIVMGRVIASHEAHASDKTGRRFPHFSQTPSRVTSVEWPFRRRPQFEHSNRSLSGVVPVPRPQWAHNTSSTGAALPRLRRINRVHDGQMNAVIEEKISVESLHRGQVI